MSRHLHARDLSPAIFTALLSTLRSPSQTQLQALGDLVLEHPHQLEELWGLIGEALKTAEPSRVQALWYLRDYLLKRAALLLVPLVERQGFTSECCVTLPWGAQDEQGKYWVESMLSTWSSVLPPAALQSLTRIATARKTQRELDKLKAASNTKPLPATRAMLDAMQDQWLSFIDAANGRRADLTTNTNLDTSNNTQQNDPMVRTNNETKKEVGGLPIGIPKMEEEEQDEDMTYEPLFAFGGGVRERPKGTTESKRDKRKRQREADDEEE